MKTGTRFVSIIFLVIIFPLVIVLIAFGAPHGYGDVGNFASFVAALLSFVSVLLLLSSLQAQRRALTAQEKANDQSRTATLITAQLQALSTLIAEDRSILDGLISQGIPKDIEAREKQKRIFRSVSSRRRTYRSKLDALLQQNFNLGAAESIEDSEVL